MDKKQELIKQCPQPVLDKARDILNYDGGFVKYIGEYQGEEVYYSAIEGAFTGFPFVYLFDGNIVTELEPHEGLRISSLLIKD